MIFIDGRRRRECAFTARLSANQDALVIIHDSRHQAVLALFEIVEDGPRFRVTPPRPGIAAASAEGRAWIAVFQQSQQPVAYEAR